MISPSMAGKLIGFLPNGLVTFLSRKILDGYIKKFANLKITGKSNLKNIKTPTIFVCNHLSNSDALILEKVLKEHDPTFVAGVKLAGNSTTNLGMNIVKTTPIKPNTADKEGLKKIIKLLKSGENIVIFPEGTRSRKGSMIEGKKGIVLIAKLAKASIVPIGIYGSEKFMPINKDGDMTTEKFEYADVFVNIGQQFEMVSREKGQDKKEFEDKALKQIMYSIAELIPEEYQGEYTIKK